MKNNILVAGMRYACPEKADYTRTAEWLGKEQPEVIMVMQTNNHYGVTIVVRHGQKELGKVSRCHLEGLLALMHSRKRKMLFAQVTSVDSTGGFFNASLDVTDKEKALFDTAERGRKNREQWEKWEWTKAPLMAALEDDLQTEVSINMLEAMIEDDWQGREGFIRDTLQNLVTSARYDVTDETAQAFFRFHQILTEHPSAQLRAYEPIFTKAMNDYGSAARQEEFGNTFFNRLYNSDEARQMMKDWFDLQEVDPADNAEMRELIDEELQCIDEAEKALPFKLYHDRNDLGKMMNSLVYKNIPRKQWQMLCSLHVMRFQLLEMWDEFCDEEMLPAGSGEDVEKREGCTVNRGKGSAEDDKMKGVVALLKGSFYGDETAALRFVEEITDKKPKQVTALVNQWVRRKLISENSRHRQLWKVLHDNGYYKCTESNWDNQVD